MKGWGLMKVTNKTRFGAIAFGCAIAVMFVAAGSASAQLTWGPTEDVVVDGSVNEVHPTAEFGFGDFQFNSLTVTGGYLEGDRIYGGSVQDHVITISGGHLKDAGGVTILGYDFNTTVNMSGGILESAGLLAIGRSGTTTEFNMSGGQLLIGAGGTANIWMPGGDGQYGTPGVLNFSGGEIAITGQDWSAGGRDILGQAWFNDQSGNAQAVWDGATTTVSLIPEPTSLVLMGLGGLMILRRRRA